MGRKVAWLASCVILDWLVPYLLLFGTATGSIASNETKEQGSIASDEKKEDITIKSSNVGGLTDTVSSGIELLSECGGV